MSYCRFNNGVCDVYMYRSIDGFECNQCKLDTTRSTKFMKTPQEALSHLNDHVIAGHLIPQYAVDRLASDARS